MAKGAGFLPRVPTSRSTAGAPASPAADTNREIRAEDVSVEDVSAPPPQPTTITTTTSRHDNPLYVAQEVDDGPAVGASPRTTGGTLPPMLMMQEEASEEEEEDDGVGGVGGVLTRSSDPHPPPPPPPSSTPSGLPLDHLPAPAPPQPRPGNAARKRPVSHRLRKSLGYGSAEVERKMGHVTIRWVYDVACGRRRSNFYTPLVFLVPCSVCFCVFMWPMLLPADLVQAAYTQTTRASISCMSSFADSVAPVVAAAYIRNKEECQRNCPPPRYVAQEICEQTTACGDAGTTAFVERRRRRRSLLQFDTARDTLRATGTVPGLHDADTMEQLSRATSPCLGCEVVVLQVVLAAQNTTNNTSPEWVEAMTRVHGVEWCARQGEAALPPFNPWATYRGITRWNDVGNTPADIYDDGDGDRNITAFDYKSGTLPRTGGAEVLRATTTNATASWPPTPGDDYDPEKWSAGDPGDATGGDANATTTTTSANVTGNNGSFVGFVDPPVNEALMEILMKNTPNAGCPKNRPGRPRPSPPPPPPPPPPPSPPNSTAGVNNNVTAVDVAAAQRYPNAPDWAAYCVAVPGRRTYGWVGEISRLSTERLGIGSWWSIMGPAFLVFPVMVINSVGMIRFVETPFVVAGLAFWFFVAVDNTMAVIRMRRCMDEVFLALNILHLSILGAAMLACLGLIGSRGAGRETVWTEQQRSWRKFMSKMVASVAVAPFSVQRANVIIRGNAQLLASKKFQKIMPSLGKHRLEYLRNLQGHVKAAQTGWKGRMWRIGFGPLAHYVDKLMHRLASFASHKQRRPVDVDVVDGRQPDPRRGVVGSGRFAKPKDGGGINGNKAGYKPTFRVAGLRVVAQQRIGKSITGSGLFETSVAVETQKPGGAERLEHQTELWYRSLNARDDAIAGSAGAAELATTVTTTDSMNSHAIEPDSSRSAPQATMRPLPALMLAWREAVHRIINARSAALVINQNKKGQDEWESGGIPKHKIILSQRMLMGVNGTLFMSMGSTILATQQIRKVLELLRWSFEARWCTWRGWGVKGHITGTIDDVATYVLFPLPAVAVFIIFLQTYFLAEKYRLQIRCLRSGNTPFTKFELVNFENSAAASEWVGFQIVLSGFTYFCTLAILIVFVLALTIPIVYGIINRDTMHEHFDWAWALFLSWVVGLAISSGFRVIHRKVFTEPRLKVVRYRHYFQFSDFLMLYITMQRSFVVVVIRLVWSAAVQAVCIMRSDMTFFPQAISKYADPPHLAYVAMVLSDWLHTCPIARNFCDTLMDIAREAGEKRQAIVRNVVLKSTLRPMHRPMHRLRGSTRGGILSDDSARTKAELGTHPLIKSSYSIRRARQEKNMEQGLRLSEEQEQEVERIAQATWRRKRARTRWFLAVTLHFNPELIKMRRPRGRVLRMLHLVKPSHLPHATKRGWLRRRGGMMGLMGNVTDNFAIVVPGVLYVFENDLASNPRALVLNKRTVIRRMYISSRDQTVGGWHFPQDYYLPDPEEMDPPDAEEGGAGLAWNPDDADATDHESEDAIPVSQTDESDGSDGEGKERSESSLPSEANTRRSEGVNNRGTPQGVAGIAMKKAQKERKLEVSPSSMSAATSVMRNLHNRGMMSLGMGGASRWKLREKYFFAISVPGKPMEVFAAITSEDAADWVKLLRSECDAMPDA